MELLNIQFLLSGLVTGIILFQTLLAAPIVFTSLETGQARIFIRKIFPRIFMVLFFIGILMFIICCFSKPTMFQYYITFITICLPAVCALMVPATNKATDNNNQIRFKFLHSLSVMFTMIVLVVNLIGPFILK